VHRNRSCGLQLEQDDPAGGTLGNGSSHICGEQGGKSASASQRRRGCSHGEEGQAHEEVEQGGGARGRRVRGGKLLAHLPPGPRPPKGPTHGPLTYGHDEQDSPGKSKKGRGRGGGRAGRGGKAAELQAPPCSRAASKGSVYMEEDPDPTAKKKRGRPRKHSLPEASDSKPGTPSKQSRRRSSAGAKPTQREDDDEEINASASQAQSGTPSKKSRRRSSASATQEQNEDDDEESNAFASQPRQSRRRSSAGAKQDHSDDSDEEINASASHSAMQKRRRLRAVDGED